MAPDNYHNLAEKLIRDPERPGIVRLNVPECAGIEFNEKTRDMHIRRDNEWAKVTNFNLSLLFIQALHGEKHSSDPGPASPTEKPVPATKPDCGLCADPQGFSRPFVSPVNRSK